MARVSRKRILGVWLNGIQVGDWSIGASSVHEFRYKDSWLSHEQTRPISLSLPLGREVHRGSSVSNFFDNLLPDSGDIRQRIKNRYRAESLSSFDLLSKIGRECVGAIQLLPDDEEPAPANRIEGRPINEHEIAGILKGLTAMGTGGRFSDEEFRISLAGAQEKTALLKHEGQWFVPHGSTPSTHIVKLPLGKIGGLRLDMAGSVENEWLCGKITAELGLETASCEIGRFEDVTALIVERFDRKITEDKTKIFRRPQEDFCQITNTPSSSKYESDGGPGIETIMNLLLGSREAIKDRKHSSLPKSCSGCWQLPMVTQRISLSLLNTAAGSD